MDRSTFTLAVAIMLVFSPPSFAQRSSSDGFYAQGFHKNYSIPNPNDPLSLAALAINPSVAQELGLDNQRVSILKKMLREAGGDLSIAHVRVGRRPGEVGPTDDEIDAQLKKEVSDRRKQLDEIMPPDKLERLKQLAYQIEIGRVGMGAALADGKLGEDFGIYENQKTLIRKRASEIEEKLREKIKLAQADAQRELLRELSVEQRDKAVQLLGTPFNYREDNFRGIDKKRFED